MTQAELARRIFKSKQVSSACERGLVEMLATSLAARAKAIANYRSGFIATTGIDPTLPSVKISLSVAWGSTGTTS